MRAAVAINIVADGSGLQIGIVQALYNTPVTDSLARACIEELKALGVAARDIELLQVPGALEVSIALQSLAEQGRFDALVALACIIRGETFHFELVASEASAGVSRIALDYRLPIGSAIVATDNLQQAVARQTDKGRDAARVAVQMARVLGGRTRRASPRLRAAPAAETVPRHC